MQFIHIFALATANNIAFFDQLTPFEVSEFNFKYKKTEGDLTKINEFGKEVLTLPANPNTKYLFFGISKDLYDQTNFSTVEGVMLSFPLESYYELWAELGKYYQEVELI
jgi:hypothetical protein